MGTSQRFSKEFKELVVDTMLDRVGPDTSKLQSILKTGADAKNKELRFWRKVKIGGFSAAALLAILIFFPQVVTIPKDKIVLHNFKDGYCGFSAIENDTYCLCYLTTKSNVKASDNSIEKMEKQILSRNPHLKFLFENSSSLWNVPEVISQVSFEKKELVFNQMPMLGDASGVIAPLCGNGMSMAFQGAFLLNKVINENPLNLNSYQKEWQKFFGSRLLTGRIIQSMFGNELTTELLINFFRFQPFLLRSLIKLTHGEKIGD